MQTEQGLIEDIATDGVERATERVARMTGLDPSLSVSEVRLHRRDETSGLGVTGPVSGATVSFDAPLPGAVAVLFSRESADHIVSGMTSTEAVPPQGLLETEVLGELAGIIASGLTDRWVETTEKAISRSGVEYVTHPRASVGESLVGDDTPPRVTLFVVECQFETATSASRCVIHAALDMSPATDAD